MVIRALYSLLLYLALPVGLLLLHWPKGSKPKIGKRWPEHLGFVPPVDGHPLWLHAVSVGEVIAVTPLVERLLAEYPKLPILVTTTTRTGADRVQAAFGERVIHRYAPLDLPDATSRFLRRTQPRLAVMMEMELWPNTLAACCRQKVPSLLINARMSDNSYRGYRRFRWLISPALQGFHSVLAQGGQDAAHLIELGADASRVTVSGSLKFDIKISEQTTTDGHSFRQNIAAHRPVWIAASTHQGEDEILLDAHQRVRQQHNDALLIIVPRHPQRFDAVASLCQRRAEAEGMIFNRRSLNQLDPTCGIYLADTMGEMMLLLAASDICFMGGSLVPNGGHNLLEPAAVGMPTLNGPFDFNFTEISRTLVAAGNCQQVADSDSLAAAVSQLIANPDEAEQAAKAGKDVVAKSQGALLSTLLAIRHHLNSENARLV
ncbi:3-deoxy-D-manno-octulosonic acid transferase [Corallincola luteus]|uniref:3-deoxy-D-manno-octulosonic acid transferase n=1 Tax=Corallincola luteus TaxID=1775177 RepID=A0ABY2ASA2_9GAMM|nr:lipid IV(A) 3-deoxy-D-manno-octulosonic acid transferase [Corallincola luteus]TCI04897.1 3-deoxy-D-manno-octulosonic acid transferase [Corallincola luteus]